MPRPLPIAALSALVLGVLSPNLSAQGAVPKAHPLVGKWQWTRDANKCKEDYDFRSDGTVQVLSGTEKTSNVYTIAAQPDARGFYQLTLKTVKDFDGKDCADDTRDSAGQQNTMYVIFEPSKERHMVCAAATPERCVGPLRRVPR